MIQRVISVVVFYTSDGKIFIQDRTNMSKNADWWLFGGGKEEGDRDEIHTAIREIQEELNIFLNPSDLQKIGYTVVENSGVSRYEVTVFVAPWKEEYVDDFRLREGAWIQWMTPKEMKQQSRTYAVDVCHMDIIEDYFLRHSPWTLHA